MNARKLYAVCGAGFCVALLSAGCPEKEEAPAAPVKSEAEIAQEAEAERRQEQTATLAARANELRAAAGELIQAAESGGALPETIESGVAELSAKAGEVEAFAAELDQASGEAWDAARTRLDGALTELESARAAASQAAADWQRREAEALAARTAGASPIDPESGLIQGLDGGDYEQYLVSVVERVQSRLRQMGLYAGPADGTFDAATLEAVGAFQEGQSLQVSGVPSPMTRSRLFEGES